MMLDHDDDDDDDDDDDEDDRKANETFAFIVHHGTSCRSESCPLSPHRTECVSS